MSRLQAPIRCRAKKILDLIRARAEAGALVLFSTHVLHEVETLTDNVMLIATGQLVAQGSVGRKFEKFWMNIRIAIRVECKKPRVLARNLGRRPGDRQYPFRLGRG